MHNTTDQLKIQRTFKYLFQSTGSGNKFYVDGVLYDNVVKFEEGKTYLFNLIQLTLDIH